jgi:hypothetical protein
LHRVKLTNLKNKSASIIEQHTKQGRSSAFIHEAGNRIKARDVKPLKGEYKI